MDTMSFELTEEASAIIKYISVKTEFSPGEILSEAIGLLDMCFENVMIGNKILITNKEYINIK